jgi:hypothetical protein
LFHRGRRPLGGRPKPLPIQNPQGIDLVGKRRDGGVDMGIVASGPLDDTPELLQVIRQKVELYLSVTARGDFQADMGHPTPEKISIILVCSHAIHPKAAAVIDECRKQVQARGMNLEVRTSMSS